MHDYARTTAGTQTGWQRHTIINRKSVYRTFVNMPASSVLRFDSTVDDGGSTAGRRTADGGRTSDNNEVTVSDAGDDTIIYIYIYVYIYI